MKKNLIYTLLLMLFLLLYPKISVGAQEIVEHKGDTLITITPRNLKTINSIIVDFENTKKLSQVQEKLIKEDSVVMARKDSVILYQQKIQTMRDNYYVSSIIGLQESLKKEKKKKKTWLGVLGSVAVILGAIAICK